MNEPLTGGTTGAEDMARLLLKYANRQKVADALIEQGYQTTRATVNRWARGDEMPGIAARMILELFGHAPDMTNSPSPEWARAMEARLTEELLTNRKVFVDTMATHFAQLGVERALGELPQTEPELETPGPAPEPAGPK